MQSRITIEKMSFMFMVWIFLFQNAKMFNFGIYSILRWVIPVILLVAAAIAHNGKVAAPPMLTILFLFAVIPSFFQSIELSTSLTKAVSFILITYCLYVFLGRKKDVQQLEQIMDTALKMIIFFQILNILFCVAGMGAAGAGRYNGFTTNANTLGIYSNLAFWAAYYYLRRNKGIYRYFSIGMIISSIILALLSGSRSGFVLILLNGIIAIFLNVRSLPIRIMVVGATAVFVYLLFCGKLDFLHISALERLLGEEGTTRGDIWKNGIEVWKDYPIFGCGYRISKLYDVNLGTEGMDFHNSYLSLLAETGIWGVTILALAVIPKAVCIVKRIFVESKYNNKNMLIVIGLMSLSLMICAWSESFLFAVGSAEAFCFWLFFIWMIVYLKKGGMTNE